jgi:NTP pyrophosphatase (non-canonical NTP hydrolase)
VWKTLSKSKSINAKVMNVPQDSIQKLTNDICEFRDARDWAKFHSPKEMAVAIVAEAGELLQHFVWQSAEQSQTRVIERRDAIAAEMADIAILLCAQNLRGTRRSTPLRKPTAPIENITSCE